MAAEMGARIEIAKRAGLLHEVSQAEEPPALIPAVLASADIVAKFGEHEDVVQAIQAIHPRSEPRSIEGLLLSAANRISEMRPGARKDNMDVFVTRLRQLELIAASFEGVKQAFAVRAGKELRVMVEAEKVTDEGVIHLSREIASRIEQELDYPGQIRVSVVREIRAVDFAV
jgi:ribonuclease Y